MSPFKVCLIDTATDGHVYEEIIETLNLNSNDIIVHLRPTNPSRSIYLIDKVVKHLIETGADAIRTISKSRFSPYKMVAVENGCIADILPQPNKFLGTDQAASDSTRDIRTKWKC